MIKTRMMNNWGCGALIFLTLSCMINVESMRPSEAMHLNDHHGKRWGVLVAGSSGYENYRHQVIINYII
jgi:hypothetical protein